MTDNTFADKWPSVELRVERFNAMRTALDACRQLVALCEEAGYWSELTREIRAKLAAVKDKS